MRKKILLIAAILFSVLQLSAQFQKNQFYFNVTGEKRFFQYNSLGVQSSLSLGLSKHSAAGVFFEYSKLKAWNYSNLKGYSQNFGVGVFYCYSGYFGKNQKWGWFVKSDLSLNQIRVFETSGTVNLNNQYNQTRLSFTPGIFYKLTPNILLHLDLASFYFTHDRYQYLNVGSNFGSQINIGITVGFGNSSKNKVATKRGY
jgi:hypothetical protein